jgi:hypothetical protein
MPAPSRAIPAKAAQAVLTIADEDAPPMHLLLGEDALKYAGYAAAGLAADIDAWKDLTLSIGFADGPFAVQGGPPVTNTLIFVDLASEDPSAAGKFYAEVFGWQNDARPEGEYHRMVPGGFFKKSDGTDSEIGNLHLGIFKAANARPHPEPAGVEPRGCRPTAASRASGC